jgi:hypothetical protein
MVAALVAAYVPALLEMSRLHGFAALDAGEAGEAGEDTAAVPIALTPVF